MLITDKSRVYPLLIEYTYTLTLPQAPTHSYAADTTPAHPQHILYTHPPAHMCPHIRWSWWTYAWCMRKLRSPHQAAPKCVRWRALCLHNLPDETTKQEEEIPLRLGCRTQALAPFCHCRHVTWITLSTTRNKAIGRTVQSLQTGIRALGNDPTAYTEGHPGLGATGQIRNSRPGLVSALKESATSWREKQGFVSEDVRTNTHQLCKFTLRWRA